MALSAGIDLAITVILCYLLYRRKDHDQTTRCGKLLDQLIVWTIQTGLITRSPTNVKSRELMGLVPDSWIYLTVHPMTMLAT
ncbi:hypothetical protein EYR36_003492 [Pleurotus pulmonarius]|nr:hypothetical protein EYR36_003492 [Pleurotus pulmonarius]